MRKLQAKIRFTPEQLQTQLDASGYQAAVLTPEQLTSVDTLVQYRYANVLANTGPYQPFVWAYITAIATHQGNSVISATSVIMNHAVTEMRRAYQQHGTT